jgi:hypothetical protein
MITIQNMAAQGDVLFRRISQVPSGAREQPRNPAEPLVVAHSETGHHHVVDAGNAVWFTTDDPTIGVLRFDGAFVDVRHVRPFHTHETLRLLGSDDTTAFEVRRQRENIPEVWRHPDENELRLMCD